MEYVLEMDDDGQRLWLCTHDDGSMRPLLDLVELAPEAGLPLGTKVTVSRPDQREAAAAEAAKLRSIFARKLQEAAARIGRDLSERQLEAMMDAVFREGIEVARRAG